MNEKSGRYTAKIKKKMEKVFVVSMVQKNKAGMRLSCVWSVCLWRLFGGGGFGLCSGLDAQTSKGKKQRQ
jgi:hypothetical protein